MTQHNVGFSRRVFILYSVSEAGFAEFGDSEAPLGAAATGYWCALFASWLCFLRNMPDCHHGSSNSAPSDEYPPRCFNAWVFCWFREPHAPITHAFGRCDYRIELVASPGSFVCKAFLCFDWIHRIRVCVTFVFPNNNNK